MQSSQWYSVNAIQSMQFHQCKDIAQINRTKGTTRGTGQEHQSRISAKDTCPADDIGRISALQWARNIMLAGRSLFSSKSKNKKPCKIHLPQQFLLPSIKLQIDDTTNVAPTYSTCSYELVNTKWWDNLRTEAIQGGWWRGMGVPTLANS